MNNDEIEKFLNGTGKKIKHGLDNLSISPAQSRQASALGQVGGGAGAITGAAIGAGIGALSHHAATGAGIGGAIGGALGSSGGAAVGLYNGRKKPVKPKTPVTKSFDESKHKRGQAGKFVAGGLLAAGAATSATGGAMSAVGHQTAKTFERKREEQTALANHNRALSHAVTPTDKKIDYMRHALGHRSAALAMKGPEDAALTLRHAGGKVALAGAGVAAAGLGAAALAHHRAKREEDVVKSFTHPSQDAQHKIAQGGLGVAALADAAGASAAWKESKNAVMPALKGLSTGKKIRTVAGYAKEKAAFPIVAGGIAATAVAEHVMHQSQKKAQPTTPRDGDGDGILNEGVRKMNSADEVFAKARGTYDEGKHKRSRDGRFSAVVGASLLGSGAATAHLSDGAKHIGQELQLHGRRVVEEGMGLRLTGDSDRRLGHDHKAAGGAFLTGRDHEKLANHLVNRGGQNVNRGYNIEARGRDALKAGEELEHAGRLGTKIGLGAAGAGLALGAYGSYRQMKSRHESLKKNDTVSTDVEAIFSKAREDVSKLERETKHGFKVGAGIGAGLGAVSGAVTGAHYGGVKGAALGAATGVMKPAILGGAIGAGVGAVKASSRKSAEQAIRAAKSEKNEGVEKSLMGLAEEGQKAFRMGQGAASYHAGNVAHAVTNPLNHRMVQGAASYHAGNVVAQARKAANGFNSLSTGKKVAAGGAGASFLAGAAALHHHMSQSD